MTISFDEFGLEMVEQEGRLLMGEGLICGEVKKVIRGGGWPLTRFGKRPVSRKRPEGISQGLNGLEKRPSFEQKTGRTYRRG